MNLDHDNVPGRSASARDLIIIFLAYAGSQIFFWWAGGRYDVGLIPFSMHFLDPRLLQTRLMESLWYMHMQPPVLNFVTGLGLQIFPQTYQLAFGTLYLFVGMILAWGVFWLARSLGASKQMALAATVLYVVGPADMYYRNWFFYTYLVMALLVCSAILLFKYLVSGRPAYGWAFFGSLFLIMMTRYSYHFVWFSVLIFSLLIFLKDRRRQLVKMAMLPLVVSLLWLGKNYYLFGSFSMSTWLGWSFSKMTSQFLTEPEIAALEAEGRISPLARLPHTDWYDEYCDFIQEKGRMGHPVPALGNQYRSTNFVNWNYINLITISETYARDSLSVLRFFPEAYWRGLRRSSLIYFWSSTPKDYGWRSNILNNYQRLWMVLGGSMGVPPCPEFDHLDIASSVRQVCWLVVIAYLVIPAYCVGYFFKRRGIANSQRASFMTVCFIAFNIYYNMLTGILLDCGVNNRFRAESIPSLVILAAVFFQRLLGFRKERSLNRGWRA